MSFSVDTKIKDLLSDEAAIAVIQKHVPEFDKKSMNMAKGMTLRAVSKFPQAKGVAKVLDLIDADLKKLGSSSPVPPVEVKEVTSAKEVTPAREVAPARDVTEFLSKEEFYDRKDASKWAHPALEAGWDMGGLSESFEDMLDPSISLDEADNRRVRTEKLVAEMLEAYPVPAELAESGTTSSVDVAVSDFEPGAAPVSVLVRTPNGDDKSRFPAIFYIPGGGLTLSEPKMFTQQIIQLSAAHKAVVVSPKYRVAPRWQYPAALNDLHSVLKWMVDNAGKLNIDTDRIIIFGGSSGGHLAAALTHRLKRMGYPNDVRPRAQILFVPVLDDRSFEPSRRINSGSWTPEEENKAWKAWLGDLFNRADVPPEAGPGHAVGDDFKGLPPAFIHTSEHDGDRDDVIRYAKGLLDAGVFCDLHLWGGFSHLSNALANAEPVMRENALIDTQIEDAFTNDLRRS